MKIALLGLALVAAALASPASAQEVIYNPGYCAQFYPNANCQNKGPGNPYTRSYQRGWQNHYAAIGPRSWRHKTLPPPSRALSALLKRTAGKKAADPAAFFVCAPRPMKMDGTSVLAVETLPPMLDCAVMVAAAYQCAAQAHPGRQALPHDLRTRPSQGHAGLHAGPAA